MYTRTGTSIRLTGWDRSQMPINLMIGTSPINRSGSKRSRRDAGGQGGSSRLRKEEEEEEGDLLDGIDEERLLEVRA